MKFFRSLQKKLPEHILCFAEFKVALLVFRFLTAHNFVRIEQKADQGHWNIFVSLDHGVECLLFSGHLLTVRKSV